ncbi:MAG: hypothetical protein HY909_00480 [Deltaproteobacteria bacterium]|nr:hypothetical protein [Deltaproteobacteria bacterium]
MRAPSPRAVAAVLAAAVLSWQAVGCAKPTPDVAAIRALEGDDTDVVVLLREVDRVGARNGRDGARLLRDRVLPLARANATRAVGLQPSHPRAQRLAETLASLLERRVTLLERYADALERDATEALVDVLRAQRQLETELTRLHDQVEAAAQPR